MSTITTPLLSPAPPLSVRTEARVCGQQVVDVTAGCTYGCIYCPYAAERVRTAGVSRPTVCDAAAALTAPAPAHVYFSASSDPFTPQAAPHTHALLAHWLPQGTVVGIVTKGIIPDETLDLLAEHRPQIEGVSIGVTSTDERRNRLVEPGVPPGARRLALIAGVAARGLPVVLRMDPLFPGIDDDRTALAGLIAEAERLGATGITAGYVLAWGRYLRRLRAVPLLADACAQLTERAPAAGGSVWSVPLARKLELFGWLADRAREHGLFFQTCGCKDLRLQASGGRFATRCCENPFFSQVLQVTAEPAHTPGADAGTATVAS